MASKGKSKWDDDEDEDAELLVRRRREKGEKKKKKSQRAKEEQSHSAQVQSPTANGVPARPLKRLKTSDEDEAETATEDNVHRPRLLSFPNRRFGPCRNVEEYERLNDIEEGSYGWVSRARERVTGTVIALKKLKMDYANDGFPVTGLREIQTLMASRHPHIVCLREVVVGSTLKDVYLVMDFIEHDLKTLLEDMAEPFLPSEVKTVMLQIVSATQYLHSHWILHRDLKTSNLLMNNRGEIKLADFGMARYTSSPPPPNLTQLCVTLWYRSPELLLGAPSYGFEIDIWSLGCIFGELLTKDPLFQGRNEVDQLTKIFAQLGTPTRETWPDFHTLPNAKALHPLLNPSSRRKAQATAKLPIPSYLSSSGLRLLTSLLALNPLSRPQASEIPDHPYFREDPRPKAKEFLPTFPSKAGQERRRRRETPNAPLRGVAAEAAGSQFGADDFARGIFGVERVGGGGEENDGSLEEEGQEHQQEQVGAGFALRLG